MELEKLKQEAARFISEKYNIRDPKIYNRIVWTDEKGIHAIGLDEISAEFAQHIIQNKKP